ncbi:DNA alkylation repair protein [Reichenbachiella sp.]|uniref:DNA alkylation repair protein n=1 Tax=Reichenbachiella sp. TaxID=2184521 RepID=UPI003BB00640
MKKLTTPQEVLSALRDLGNPDTITFKEKKYAIRTENSLGIYQKDLKALAKRVGKNDQLALDLFDSGLYEARLLVPLLFKPRSITPTLIDQWIACFDTWEICDSYCMSFIGQSPHCYEKVFEYVDKESEYQKRAGFVLMVGYHFGHKNAPNEEFQKFLPLIIEGSEDERNFVKKAINWALRVIGKRNIDLNAQAITTAQQILKSSAKSAQWIAKDALKELQSPKVNIQDYPRSIYRPK